VEIDHRADIKQSARMTLAYHLHALGLHEAAMTVFSDADPGQDPKLGVVQGDAAVLERIRSRCLRGKRSTLFGGCSAD
jgi:hypothetical protein